MRVGEIGIQLRKARTAAGLTQAGLAKRIGTSQSAVARSESGMVAPSLDYIERVVTETQAPLQVGSLLILPVARPVQDERRERVRRALGEYRFDPWDRDPTDAEQRTLTADGLDRGSVER